jgi:hypothetical protein
MTGLSVKVGPTYRDLDDVSDLRYLWDAFSHKDSSDPDETMLSFIQPIATINCLSNHAHFCDLGPITETREMCVVVRLEQES